MTLVRNATLNEENKINVRLRNVELLATGFEPLSFGLNENYTGVTNLYLGKGNNKIY